MGQWSDLPADLLILIDKEAVCFDNKIRLRCICMSWQSALPELPDLRQPQPPWLLLPYESGSLCGLYHPFEENVYEVDLPEVGEKVFVGSDYGWIVAVQQNGSIDVVNPLTRVRVQLPPRYTFPDVVEYCPDKVGDEYLLENEGGGEPFTVDAMHVRDHFITKIALSCSPASGDFVAVAQYRVNRLAYCKSGDEKWCDLVDFDGTLHKYRDITFFGGKLYALPNFWTVGGDGQELRVCDDFASCPKLRICLSFSGFPGLDECRHLINSSHGLVLADRRYEQYPQIEGSDTEHVCNTQAVDGEGDDDDTEGYDSVDGEGDGVNDSVDGEGDDDEGDGVDDKVIYYFYTSGFDVYKVDMSSSRLIHMERLDDEILFMGLGTQLCFSYKQFKTSRGNQIYFANHMFGLKGIHDYLDDGVFDFEDQSIKPIGYERKICRSPIWVMPDPY